jgi:eukaryotic-like serine/threonine-protein kinase
MGRWQSALKLLPYSRDPTVRSYLIEQLGTMVEARALLGEGDRSPEVSVRQALLLALGDFGQDRLSLAERDLLIPGLEKVYRDDPDRRMHGAAGWLLHHWGQTEKVAEIDNGLRRRDKEVARRGRPSPEGRQWYVNGQGQTMVVLPPGEFRIAAAQRLGAVRHARQCVGMVPGQVRW